jgi:SAM-dependent methyltransferase
VVRREIDCADLQHAPGSRQGIPRYDAQVPPAESCPVCEGAFNHSAVERWAQFVLRQCSVCGLQLWDPPVPADSAWYDASDHYLAMPIVDWLGWYHSWAIEHLPPEVHSLLDVGCADGRFVNAVVARGIDGYGVDHSLRLVEMGNRRYGGSRLSRATIKELVRMGKRFDAVTLFEVIEHVPDPLGVLREVRGLLRPEGVLVVSTPNRLGRPRPPAALDRPPHHLTRWSPAALRFALERAGFTPVDIGLSPGRVGLTAYLLDKVRLGLVVHVLRIRAHTAVTSTTGPGDRDVRAAILLKERIFSVFAGLLAPIIGWRFRAGSMVVIARRNEGAEASG